MNTVEMMHTDMEVLSIEKFMSLSEKQRNEIQAFKIIPPKITGLMGDDFGKILVKYKVPTYKGNIT